MNKICFYFLVAAIVQLPLISVAQVQGPLSSVNIGGVNMYCTTAQGQLAAIYVDPSVNQFIGRASHNGYPTIQLGPGFFNSVPGFVGQFWFLHECAHHVVGGNEAASDCFAIRNMRSLGLIYHPNQVATLLNQISQMPGSYTHLPGPARAQNIYACLNG
ncbi:hypothetical protein HII17_00685 [Thalassotalea sp. M1531]|uniref:Uncharacterized protein n=1 Tax=Thalassotalea algicola TaxID=2716224 RepID=A0A7Y0Q5T3_9GAMM|nr:hypothetical protein [Thalassotalea algicola]NMP30062.1 hypothetical protein [Thalassotalea algicola]